MSLPPITATLAEESRAVILGAIDRVMRCARTGYAPERQGSVPTATVDFHPYAATQARQLIADAPAEDGRYRLTLSVPQHEAVTKILMRSRHINSPERKKVALAARKALGALAA